jgi:phospholipid/cholesterol/gamma-HCH transport system ATP-binding protein
MPSQIRLDNISYSFGTLEILSNVNITVPSGQIVILMGRSGSGKSTILEISAGLIEPSSGKVLWDGREIHDLSQSEITAERRKIGFVFQKHALISNMTVFDNIALPLRYHSTMPERELGVMVGRHLDKYGISELKNKLPEALSVGQARLVAIARALILDPELLFLDEPISGLGPVVARKVIDILFNLGKQSNLTIFIVSHIISFIERLQCPLLFLDKGTVTYYEGMDSFRRAEETFEFVSSFDGVR